MRLRQFLATGWTRRLAELLGYGLGPLVAMITTPLLARELGPAGRGDLAVVLAVSGLVLVFGELGQPELFMRSHRKSDYRVRAGFSAALLGCAVAGGCGFIYCMVTGLPVVVALIGLLPIPGFVLSDMWRVHRLINGDTRTPTLAAVLLAVSRLVCFMTAYLTGCMTLVVVLLIYQATQTLSPLAVSWWVEKRATSVWGEVAQRVAPPRVVVAHARAGLIMWVFHAATAVTLRIDVLLLAALSGSRAVGIYAAAVGLSQSVLSVSIVFRNRLQALVLTRAGSSMIFREVRLIAVLVLIPVLLVMFFASSIQHLLLGDAFVDAGPILRIMALAAVGQLLMDLAQGLLIALGEMRALVVNAYTGAALTALALAVLIPRYGAIGAAWASFVAYSAVGSLGLLSASRALTRCSSPNPVLIEEPARS
jgi:O-antigen/teichoic acid export membrane protein